jgi:2-polyprenyl-3-methyl-5-hydroxy-6-metoxy-1,4-benzoquinol methylase
MQQTTELQAAHACPLCRGPARLSVEQLAGWRLWTCPACRHTFAPDAFATLVDYDAVYAAAGYRRDQVEPVRQGRDICSFAALTPYRTFLHVLGAAHGRSVLDVGCGTGRFLLAARARGWQASGIDISEQACAVAQAAGLPVRCTDARHCAEGPARFDVVTAFDVLEHVADPVALLRDVLGLVRPGGWVFLCVPNWDCPLFHGTCEPDWLPPVHLQFFTASSLRRALQLAGPPPQRLGEARPAGLQPLARTLYRRLRGRPTAALQLWAVARCRRQAAR